MTKSTLIDRFPIGARVVGLTAFRMGDRPGQGRFVADGCEGEWFVVEATIGTDLGVARSLNADYATHYLPVSRVEGAPEAEWREHYKKHGW